MNSVSNRLCTAALALLTAAASTTTSHAWLGMATPKLTVNGRFLQDPTGKNVLLHGYFQPQASWFNGEGNRYANPTDYTNPANVAPCLNFLRDAATVMSDTNPKYGRNHGWYSSFVRIIGDGSSPENFAPGWNAAGQLASSAQFNGWINNLLVPYINHCRTRGLYVVICGNPSLVFPGGDHGRNMTQQYQQNLTTFWTTVANAPGIKSADNVMFEICNEPVTIETSFGANNWGSGSGPYFQALRNFMQPIVNAIRNTGADNIILLPGLGWQGESHGYAQYPVTGSNIGIAAHLYPAYGGVHNNATAVQNFWNSNYKPAADLKPMVITEMMWFPNPPGGYDDLFNGTTAGFGNAAKNAIDNQGNVSYLIGFLADNLYNLVTSTPANCTLGSGEGVQAAFAWWPTYTWAAPGNSGPIANGTYRIIARHSGKALDAYGNQTTNGTQIIQWAYSGGNNQRWTVTDRGSGQYSIVGVQSGRAVDVNNWGTANGTKVQLWDYFGGTNQKFTLAATSGGYYRITPTHATGSCLDVAGISTADGALVHLWQWLNGNNQQWAFQAP